MFRPLIALLACLILGACAGGAVAPSGTQVAFPAGPANPGLTLRGSLYKPQGPGPFSAVVVLHHCGGADSETEAYARRLTAEGYVTIVPDSFGARGVGSVCATFAVTPAQRVPDAYAAAAYLRTLPEVRGDRIGLLGFSHGGGVISDLIRHPPAGTPFRAAVAYYPGCGGNPTIVTVPTLILVGERDDWTPAPPCVAWQARTADPNLLDVVVYPGATHKFDGASSRDTLGRGGVWHHLVPDPGAAGDARQRTDAFFARWLKS